MKLLRRTVCVSAAHIAVLLLVAAPASADLGEADLLAPGDGLLTVDSASGLEWLDLTETTGQTYDAVLAGFGGFTTTLGFRFATASEVSALYTNAGVNDQTNTYAVENFAGVGVLLQLLGCTAVCSGNTPFEQGLADFEPFDPLICDSPFVQQRLSTEEARAAFSFGREKAAFSNAAVGSFLVRATVVQSVPQLPGPGIAALAALLLGALWLTRPGAPSCPHSG